MVVRKVKRKSIGSKKPRAGVLIESEVADLERQLAEKKELLEAIRIIESKGMAVITPASASPARKVVRKASKPVPIKKPVIVKPVFVLKSKRKLIGRRYGRTTWSEAMWRVLQDQKQGISYGDLLAELVKGELGENRSKGDKGFYQAIRRLSASGDVVKIRGLLYTASLAAALRASGEAPPEAPRLNGRGAARPIIKSILENHPRGLTGPQIKELAAKHPEAPSSLRSDSHYIYNVLGLMKKDEEITHEGNVYKVATKEGGAAAVH